ncbi:MAG: FUN14 domain-containing protein [Candidatus Nitrosopolaris sp.]
MIDSTLTQTLVPFAGSGVCGYIAGFALRKILKFIMILCALILGGFFFGLILPQSYGFLTPNAIKWDRLGNSLANTSQSWINGVMNNDNSTRAGSGINIAHNIIHGIGLPISSGLTIGLIAGFIHTR